LNNALTRFTLSYAKVTGSKLAVFFLLLGTSFFWNPSASAEQTGQITVVCANDAGEAKNFRVGWDNTTGFFEGKGNIAALFCQIASGGYKTFISTTAPESTWYYNGVAPTPVQSDTATPSPSVSPTPSPVPQQTETPTVVETAPQSTPPAIVETPTAIVETATVPASNETQTVSSETTTVVQDTSTAIDTNTATSNPPSSGTESGTSVPTPPPAVESKPTPAPVAPTPQPEPQPQPVPVEIPAPTPAESAPPLAEEPPAEPPVVVEEPPAPAPEIAPEPVPVEEPAPVPVEEVQPEPQPEPPLEPPLEEETEPLPQPTPEPTPPALPDIAPEPPVVAAPNATDAEKEIVAQAIIEQAHGEPVTAQAIADAGLTYADLPPATPVEVRQDENGNEVVITAEVAAALVILENPAELLNAIFTDPAQALLALGSIGADMSDEERAESEKTVVAAVIVGQIAGQAAVTAAAGAAAYRRKP
jgi:hypothetical protein